MIGLAGDLCGVLSFRCSVGSAVQIAGRMLGTDERTSEESIRDALGEICNMVAGSFKAQLSDVAEQCMLSVPTVVSGKDYRLYPLVDGLRIQIARSFEGALVWMTLDLHNS
jgi:chemotaxis protein CheX